MKQIILFLIILVISVTFLLFTIVNSLGHNVISPSKFNEYYLKILLPQEWGFYSKDPKILDLAYVKIDGAEIIQPNANIKTAWGLNRGARAQGTEAGLIYHKAISMGEIKEANNYYTDFIKKTKKEPFIKIKNTDSKKTFKGKYIFYSGEVVPFSWAKSTEERHIVKKYVKVEVE